MGVFFFKKGRNGQWGGTQEKGGENLVGGGKRKNRKGNFLPQPEESREGGKSGQNFVCYLKAKKGGDHNFKKSFWGGFRGKRNLGGGKKPHFITPGVFQQNGLGSGKTSLPVIREDLKKKRRQNQRVPPRGGQKEQKVAKNSILGEVKKRGWFGSD